RVYHLHAHPPVTAVVMLVLPRTARALHDPAAARPPDGVVVGDLQPAHAVGRVRAPRGGRGDHEKEAAHWSSFRIPSFRKVNRSRSMRSNSNTAFLRDVFKSCLSSLVVALPLARRCSVTARETAW